MTTTTTARLVAPVSARAQWWLEVDHGDYGVSYEVRRYRLRDDVDPATAADEDFEASRVCCWVRPCEAAAVAGLLTTAVAERLVDAEREDDLASHKRPAPHAMAAP